MLRNVVLQNNTREIMSDLKITPLEKLTDTSPFELDGALFFGPVAHGVDSDSSWDIALFTNNSRYRRAVTGATKFAEDAILNAAKLLSIVEDSEITLRLFSARGNGDGITLAQRIVREVFENLKENGRDAILEEVSNAPSQNGYFITLSVRLSNTGRTRITAM